MDIGLLSLLEMISRLYGIILGKDFKHENLLLVLLNVCLWFLHLFLSHLSMTFLNIHHILTISCKIIFVSFIIIFVLIFQLISAYFYLFQLITHFHLYELIFPLIFTYFSSYLYLFLLLILLTCFIWIRQTL